MCSCSHHQSWIIFGKLQQSITMAGMVRGAVVGERRGTERKEQQPGIKAPDATDSASGSSWSTPLPAPLAFLDRIGEGGIPHASPEVSAREEPAMFSPEVSAPPGPSQPEVAAPVGSA